MDSAITQRPPDNGGHADELDRAYGGLLGLAIGDALGMPTQGFSRPEVAARWAASGGVLEGFVGAPGDNAISAGLPAGRVTDDTDQAVILGGLLVEGNGHVDPHRFAAALAEWEAQMRAAGSLDLLGPSTKSALAALASGLSVDESGRGGTTNGAAMRIAPVGIATPPEPLLSLVDAVADASRVTHNTGSAIAGAAAVAAAVSSAMACASIESVVAYAIEAARLGQRRGHPTDGPDIGELIRAAARLGREHRALGDVHDVRLLDAVTTYVGTSLATHESVPAVFAIVSARGEDAWHACRLAASLGGDSDTIAAMTGAVLGAAHGAGSFPSTAVAAMLAANPDLDLTGLAFDLLALRHSKDTR